MATCECHIAAEFPILGGYGIISANLRTGSEVSVTEAGVVLEGPTTGDLSISAYAPLNEILACPGRAGVSFNWDRRIECDETGVFVVHLIPRGRAKAYKEGDITADISLTEVKEYQTFSASASSGPTTVYLYTSHTDAYDFTYKGTPIPIVPDDAYNKSTVTLFGNILPQNSELYLQSFSWEYTPPNIPQVSYSYLFIMNEGR